MRKSSRTSRGAAMIRKYCAYGRNEQLQEFRIAQQTQHTGVVPANAAPMNASTRRKTLRRDMVKGSKLMTNG